MGLFNRVREKPHKNEEHIARRTIREGLDILVDLNRKRVFLEGLGSHHELSSVIYANDMLSCKLPGKYYFNQTVIFNIPQWSASFDKETTSLAPEQVLRHLEGIQKAMTTPLLFEQMKRRQELEMTKAAIVGNFSDRVFPSTHQKLVEEVTKEYTSARQYLVWSLEAAKALKEKRYSL